MSHIENNRIYLEQKHEEITGLMMLGFELGKSDKRAWLQLPRLGSGGVAIYTDVSHINGLLKVGAIEKVKGTRAPSRYILTEKMLTQLVHEHGEKYISKYCSNNLQLQST